MTKLPEKDLLTGTKTPRTTTGEMKNALGKLRDYLAELFGDDSMDKEKARQTLGIDLSALSDKSDIEAAMSMKADKTELENKANKDEIEALEAEIARRGIPVGSIDYFAMATPPSGYLKADGSEVGRETYPDLFAAIGTAFGNGDGTTTFNLPDLMDRFPQGSMTPGIKKEAGLPDITGTFRGLGQNIASGDSYESGAFKAINTNSAFSSASGNDAKKWDFAASRSNPLYGASMTVQPCALTLLPCIKAFDAATNPGLVDVTALAAGMNDKLGKAVDGKVVRFVKDSFRDGANWWRKWSDGWIEQGGMNTETVLNRNIVFHLPMLDTSYSILTTVNTVPSGVVVISVNTKSTSGATMYATYSTNGSSGAAVQHFQWYVFGQGTPS